MKILPMECQWCGGEPCSNDIADEGREWCEECGRHIEGPQSEEEEPEASEEAKAILERCLAEHKKQLEQFNWDHVSAALDGARERAAFRIHQNR